jgi:dUTP pyrophosphatase
MPSYATGGAAGADVRSAEPGPVTIESGERAAVATGLVFEIPEGWEIQVRPRSGLAWRQGLTVVNAPGTIDSDYRGEVKVLLVNLGSERLTVERGDRVAQLILSPVHRAMFVEVEALTETERAEGGFGSTGRA